MYFYYALSTIGAKPAWPIIVTILQIVQFVVDLALFGYGFKANAENGWKCQGPISAWVFGAVVLTSFLALFVHLFVKRYILGGGKKHAAGESHKRKSSAKQE